MKSSFVVLGLLVLGSEISFLSQTVPFGDGQSEKEGRRPSRLFSHCLGMESNQALRKSDVGCWWNYIRQVRLASKFPG